MPMPVLGLRPRGDDEALRQDADVLPLDPPRCHASGPAPYRILAVGGRHLAGHGVTTHDLALTGAVARGFSRFTGHGADVDAVVLDRPDASAIARELRRRDLSRIDALVLVLGAGDGLVVSADAARRFNRLLVDVWNAVTPGAGVTVVLPPGLVERSEGDRAAFLEALLSGAAGLTRVVELAAPPAGATPRQRYAAWGAQIAEGVAAGVVEPLAWSDPLDRIDERRRSAAVRRSGPFDADWEASLQRLVQHVARAYGATSASVTVIQGDEALYLAGREVAVRSVPRHDTICETAMHAYGGVIVGDAQADDRFKDMPLIRSGQVRFYAGYRIESPDGLPLGVLCVFDAEPREVRNQDLALLRDFALIAQRRIRERAARASA